MNITDELIEALEKWEGLKVNHIKVDRETMSKLKVEAKDTMCFSFEEPRKFFFYGHELITDPGIGGYKIE